MVKGSSSLRERTSGSSKPYDVSNSFVKRVASRVTELLPQPTSWLSRWMAPPSEGPNTTEYPTPRLPATSRSELNFVANIDNHMAGKKARIDNTDTPKLPTTSTADVTVSTDNHIPAKRARIANCDYLSNQKKFKIGEDLSPITLRPEPVAGPSSRQERPAIISSTPAQPHNISQINGDDCSETSESTSGCSSLVPQAQSTIRSLGGSQYRRNLTTNITTDSLHRRRPSFNTTTFSSPSRVSMRERIGSSPFYSGRTMYGGSSQAHLLSATQSPQRRVRPTVKPLPAKTTLPLSSTAKRILDALEQFSTPLTDAKRMPVTGSKNKTEACKRYTELSIPSTPELLRVKRRERLQQSTSAARQTATSAKSSPTVYTIRKEDLRNIKQTGKLKSTEKVDDELPVEVNLPSASLHINELPKIDIAIPPAPPPSTVPITRFKFSSPSVLSPSDVVSVSVKKRPSSYKFSEPISELSSKPSVDNKVRKSVPRDRLRTKSDNLSKNNKTSQLSVNVSKDTETSDVKNTTTTPSTNFVGKSRINTTCEICFQPTTNSLASCDCQKTQINMDNKVSGTSNWRCQTCEKDNLPETVTCKYCQSNDKQKSLDTNKNHVKNPSFGFGNMFQKEVGSWECSECLIQNKKEAEKCAACEAPKRSSAASNGSSTGFGNKFQKAAGSWDCKVCLIVNKDNATKCIACDTPKEELKSSKEVKIESNIGTKHGFGDMFKKAAGSWSCEVCMVSNNAEQLKCLACETVKPGATLPMKTEQASSKFSFGIPPSSSDKGPTFSFGIPKDAPPAATNSNLIIKSNSLAKSSESVQNFSFGIPTTATGQGNNSPKIGLEVSSNQKMKVSELKSVEAGKPKINSLINTSSSEPKLTNSVGPLSEKSDLTNDKNTLTKDGKSGNISPIVFDIYKSAQNPKANPSNLAPSSESSSQVFKFGAKQESFGSNIASSTTNTISASSASNIFNFSDTKTVSSSTEMSSITSPKTQPSIANLFSFGSSSNEKKPLTFDKSSNLESQTDTKGNKDSSDSTNKKTTFNSLPTTQSQTQVFETKNPLVSNINFENKDKSQTSFPSAPVVFGAADTKSLPTPNSFSLFGQTSSQATQPTAGFAFNPNSEKTPKIGFGFPASCDPPAAPKMFNFNNANTSTPNMFNASGSVPSFNSQPAAPAFGAPATGSQTGPVFGEQRNPAPIFAFGSQSTHQSQTPANPVFEFGSSQQQQNAPVAPSPSFVFGANATPSAPVFGVANSAAPAFGNSAPPAFGTTSIPVFGSTANSVAPTFGVAPAAPTFGMTPNSPAPAFDPTVKPTFNFSQGSSPIVFSATNPSGTPPPQRRIRKALRRGKV